MVLSGLRIHLNEVVNLRITPTIRKSGNCFRERYLVKAAIKMGIPCFYIRLMLANIITRVENFISELLPKESAKKLALIAVCHKLLK